MEHQYTYDELHQASIDRLREIAAGLEDAAVQGFSQMNKGHLLEALCNALHIDMHAHHNVVGLNKKAVKDQIQELKGQRDAALAAHDHTQLKRLRRRIHRLKRNIHRATV